MPYDLYLDEEEPESCDIDLRLNNLNNFYHWCASRVLSLDRKYAKEILNSIGAAQAVTDRDRADISLSYHLSLIHISRRANEARMHSLSAFSSFCPKRMETPVPLPMARPRRMEVR